MTKDEGLDNMNEGIHPFEPGDPHNSMTFYYWHEVLRFRNEIPVFDVRTDSNIKDGLFLYLI